MKTSISHFIFIPYVLRPIYKRRLLWLTLPILRVLNSELFRTKAPTDNLHGIHAVIAKVLRYMYHKIPVRTSVGALIRLLDVDMYRRYAEAAGELLNGELTLDIGSGGKSLMTQFIEGDVVSLDISADLRPDIVADAMFCPFREKTFTNVLSVATIEHIQKEQRNQVLAEMMRICRKRVVIFMPCDDGKRFLGKTYDLLYMNWFKRVLGYYEPNTLSMYGPSTQTRLKCKSSDSK